MLEYILCILRTYAVYRNMPQHLVYLISNKSQDVEVLRKSCSVNSHHSAADFLAFVDHFGAVRAEEEWA